MKELLKQVFALWAEIKAVFDPPTVGMSFPQAFFHILHGRHVARELWDVEGDFVSAVKTETDQKDLLPDFMMVRHTAEGPQLWDISQADVLAHDWYLLPQDE
jgi:hypothetical protein